MRFSLRGVLFLAVLVQIGCSPMRYSQYTGRDTVWPNSVGAMAETAYAIPVYRGTPERPYQVIGSVRFEDPRRYWDDGIIRKAANVGKKKGGDAIVLRFGSAAPGSWLDQWTSRPTGYGEEPTALVIKWTPQSVIQTRKEEEARFWTGFRGRFPDLSGNDQLVQIALGYLGETGVTPGSQGMEDRLSALLTELQKQPKNDLAGKWLFKGSVQSKTLTSSDSDTFYGIATVAISGNKISMISTEGKIEANFSGTLETGQLSGLLGLGGKNSSLSVKADGVALGEKISLTFQKLTDSGTVQGNLTFQR